MKRIISTIIVLLLGTSIFAGYTYLDNLVKDLTIYGYLDEYVILYVNPITASSSSTTGMPFDITGSDVKYNASDKRLGRQVCFWSFATNMPKVKLTITADPLTNENNSSFKINYYMTFAYEYSKVDANGGSSDVIGYLTMHSGQTENQLYNYTGNTLTESGISFLMIDNVNGNEAMPVISMNKDVRIMFDENAPADFQNYPEGYYYSDVTIVLEGV